MPSINTLKIKGFKAFPKEFEITLNGRHLLMYGENGSGKSSIYYALHCLFQSALKSDAGKKYFNITNTDGSQNNQHLKNINQLDAESEIIIDFTESHPFIYSIDKNGYNTTTIGGRHPLPANINGVFVNHQFLFYFFGFRNSERVNLFPVFAKDVLSFVKDEVSTFHLGEMYDQIRESVKKKGKRVTKEYLEKIEYFNTKVKKMVVEEINLRASDNYNKYFRSDSDQFLQILLRYDSNTDKPIDDLNEYWLKYDKLVEIITENEEIKERRSPYKNLNTPFIGLEISEMLDDGTYRKIEKPHVYFNEAKLTAIALSIRFALLNLDKPEDGRFLALDDMLISLDMSNRKKVITFLLKIADKYKIYLFTHDRAFFELAKEIIQSTDPDFFKDKWFFKELYNGEDKNVNPLCLDSEDSYARAILHYKNFDYPASANYLRKSAEDLISIFPVYISKDNNGLTKDKLRPKLEAALSLLRRLDGDIEDVQNLFYALSILLNPLSHRSIDTNIYKSELKMVIDIIPRINQHILALDIKEVVAKNNYVYFNINENETTSCQIEIEMIEPLYSYLGLNGERLLSKSIGHSKTSITTVSGLKGDSKEHCFNKGTLEEICNQMHTFLKKGITEVYWSFYQNKEGKPLKEFLENE